MTFCVLGLALQVVWHCIGVCAHLFLVADISRPASAVVAVVGRDRHASAAAAGATNGGLERPVSTVLQAAVAAAAATGVGPTGESVNRLLLALSLMQQVVGQ